MRSQYLPILCIFFLLHITAGSVQASSTNYPFADIPDSLVRSANIVKRLDEMIVEVKSISKATIYRKYAYTILNESGQSYAPFVDTYDKFRRIHSITGTLYDKDGNKIRQVKHRDIYDGAMDDQMSLALDTRFKHYDFAYRNYPYTVEYEEEMELNGIFDLPDWRVMPQSRIAIQNSSFTVRVPDGYVLRYKQLNYSGEPLIEQMTKEKQYRWELKNVKAIIREPMSPSWEETAPAILIAPADFEIDGYKGNMSDWLHFGQFINQLYTNRDVLPQPVKDKVHQLTDKIPEVKEKVRLLYEFMQQNTHYISIQLGIGGWQPFDASFVANKKYGDCKALSNYMCALLKEAGIKGNSVLIYGESRTDRMVADFPSNQFNHAIACVPMEKDTVWLECTSQTISAGYMGSFTSNRKALLLAADGGHVVMTPRYTATDNRQERKTEVVIDENGNMVAEVRTHTTGEQQELPHHLIHGATKEEREKLLNKMLELPTYTVVENEYKEIKGVIPEVNEYLKIESPGYASVTGKRLFIKPNLFNNQDIRLTRELPRKTDVVIKAAFRDVDTLFIRVPEGYTVESIPAPATKDSRFGSYRLTYRFTGNTLTVIRVWEMQSGRFPPESYTELVKLYDDIYKADMGRVVLIKNQF